MQGHSSKWRGTRHRGRTADLRTTKRAKAQFFPNRAAAARFGKNCAFARFVVRRSAVRPRCRVPRHFDECPCISPGRTDPSQLLVFVHTAKTDYASMYLGRRDPGRRTTVDRLGSSVRAYRFRGLGALRHRLPLAIPSFHVHRVDVSRRLRARRLPRLARKRAQRPLCCLAVPTARPRPFRSGDRSCTSRSGRNRLLCRGAHSWRRLSLLQRTLRPSKVRRQRAAAASCFNPLSSGAVCSARGGQEMILTKTRHLRRERERNAKTMLTGIRFPRALLAALLLSLVQPSASNAQNVEPF